MSHKTVYMGISADKLKGDITLENISAYVEKTMKNMLRKQPKKKILSVIGMKLVDVGKVQLERLRVQKMYYLLKTDCSHTNF